MDGESAAVSTSSVSAAPARPFAFAHTARKYERDRPFRIDNIALDIVLDVPEKSIEAVAVIDVHRLDEEATTFKLDAVAYRVRKVEIVSSPSTERRSLRP